MEDVVCCGVVLSSPKKHFFCNLFDEHCYTQTIPYNSIHSQPNDNTYLYAASCLASSCRISSLLLNTDVDDTEDEVGIDDVCPGSGRVDVDELVSIIFSSKFGL
jgi:hypothetical protein